MDAAERQTDLETVRIGDMKTDLENVRMGDVKTERLEVRQNGRFEVLAEWET